MGKPRLIILIRHAQSEGNKNREIHQMIPDHRVKLTDEGRRQAEDAGRRLRHLLKPDDTLQIFTSPYRRTRETTEGILKTLTASHDDEDPYSTPSPFSRNKIKVYEEPRLREQDFGNFQPCSAEMERMWRERADYGHFFYRIPNGESAADAYDRVSGFNESLWRQFGERDFPSVCVLVTHGLMTRVFLMKWYHWSVEYFEDLRNINHCEFILMRQNMDNGKYILENNLRTWSELKRQRAAEAAAEEARKNPSRRNTLSAFLAKPVVPPRQSSPSIPARKWGGCVDGCDHHNDRYPRRVADTKQDEETLPPAGDEGNHEGADHAGPAEPGPPAGITTPPQDLDGAGADDNKRAAELQSPRSGLLAGLPPYLRPGRDGGGTTSGENTPHEMSDNEDYFREQELAAAAGVCGGALKTALPRRPLQRQATPEDVERWVQESGMGRGKRADALGDEPDPSPSEFEDEGLPPDVERQASGRANGDAIKEVEKAEKADKSLRGSVY